MKKNSLLILSLVILPVLILTLSTCKTAQLVAVTEVPEGVEPRRTLVLSRTSLVDLGPQQWLELPSGVIIRSDGDSLRLDIPVPLSSRMESTPAKMVDRSTNIEQLGESNQAIIGRRPEAQQGTGNVAGKRNDTQAAKGEGIALTSTKPAQSSWLDKLKEGISSLGFLILLMLILVLIVLRYLKKHLLP